MKPIPLILMAAKQGVEMAIIVKYQFHIKIILHLPKSSINVCQYVVKVCKPIYWFRSIGKCFISQISKYFGALIMN